jgi:hypothetical protein
MQLTVNCVHSQWFIKLKLHILLQHCLQKCVISCRHLLKFSSGRLCWVGYQSKPIFRYQDAWDSSFDMLPLFQPGYMVVLARLQLPECSIKSISVTISVNCFVHSWLYCYKRKVVFDRDRCTINHRLLNLMPGKSECKWNVENEGGNSLNAI